ncbi:MAG: hypothetical protein JJU34_17190 [Lunatimonas sp.]|uniref:hypothetical protein n=1 Tax=Lunatimonas sp. TaxID=2060141 RepID=UPI00263B0B3D|nr:hypothetical protein [Lunatimonas sp.]MCC5939017.1 hypothetical protein [Lunatimonas sp.]
MDSGTIFYIIAVVIYFIYSALQQKKGQPKDGEVPGESQDTPRDIPKNGTFEDLLREIRREQGEREEELVITSRPATTETHEPIGRNPKVDREEVVTSSTASRMADAYGKYQSKQPLVKLDDQVDIHDDKKILGKVESVTVKNNKNPYAQLLKSPNTLRDAVVVSEILNRRHF